MESRNPFFGKVAEKYDMFFETSYGKAVFELEKQLLLKVLSRENSLLEVGCGTGFWSKVLIEEDFKEPTGIDISKDMLAIAKKKGLKKLVLGNAEFLPFKSDSFDTAFFVTSLEFIKNKKRAFVEAVRVSRKSVVVAFLNRYSFLCLYRALRSFFKESIYTPGNFLTVDEVKNLSKYAGSVLKEKFLIPGKLHSTLSLSIDGFVNKKWEELIGFDTPFGGFTVLKFYIRKRHGNSKRDRY
ncbi:Methyltransferase type 11 [Desulfurobacterium thermolithotrophum DSM 11699]|uniref:Methyltransferase type 11 n=1 Tax=Desulfurobacterium thermolithotrophum (strain DSM 11699 / BSA) TaxID=868864 RepID=F0S305_DESTD|nr:class I SAM-dependent methyltransferase [Desulfurobacterium thermolithotrophum]ADY73227.1 Methyltransferase type 11 [Desulfurobacterium thermolithotrophum DSM 11699]